MYAIKSIYGSRYINGINLTDKVIDSHGNFTTKYIIQYHPKVYLTFESEEDAWDYINSKRKELINIQYGYKELYNLQYNGAFKRILNSLSNLCVVRDEGLFYHGRNSNDDIERFKWCKLRKYRYYK